ncbi:phosphoglycerate mutase family protein-like protein, partial [Aspergillus sclerotiicarbonarius CBS 121057]
LRDPLLTTHGKEQCHALREALPFHASVSLIMASPLKRAIQTAATVFAPTLASRQLPFMLIPLAQEVSQLQCYLGDDVATTKAGAPDLITDAAEGYDPVNLDVSLVQEDWNSKQGIYAATLPAVRRRAAALRNWLWKRPEEHIAVVSHGGFLHYLTEDWTGYDKARGELQNTGYQNCEYRRFQFSEDSTAESAHLVEIGNAREKQARPVGLDAHVVREIEEVEGKLE